MKHLIMNPILIWMEFYQLFRCGEFKKIFYTIDPFQKWVGDYDLSLIFWVIYVKNEEILNNRASEYARMEITQHMGCNDPWPGSTRPVYYEPENVTVEQPRHTCIGLEV